MLINKSMFPVQAGYNAISRMQADLGKLQMQLGNGQKAQTLAEMGSDRSVSLALRGRLTSLESYKDNIATVNLRLGFLDNGFSTLSKLKSEARTSATPTSYGENNLVMASLQKDSHSRLGLVIDALNTHVGGRYLMGGNRTEVQPVADLSAILDGNGTAAGYKTVVNERNRADLGADVASTLGELGLPMTSTHGIGSNRLVISSKDLERFGYELVSISGNTPNLQTKGPTVNPLGQTVKLSANLADGTTTNFTLKRPDGSSTTVALTAVSGAPGSASEFQIGATPAETAAKMQEGLEAAVGDLDAFASIATNNGSVKVVGHTDGAPALGITVGGTPGAGDIVRIGVKSPDGTTELIELTPTGATVEDVMDSLREGIANGIGVLTATIKTGRLDVVSAGDTVTLTEQDTIFGHKLGTISTNGANITVGTAPLSVQFNNPVRTGDSVTIGLTMPDGTSDSVTLRATDGSPGIGQFVIGANAVETASNFAAALRLQLDETSKTKLVAASTFAAADDFFTADGIARRVGDPIETATAYATVSKPTVRWYSGEVGESGDNPRLSATAQVDDATKVAYGVRANETGLIELVRTLAAMSVQEYPLEDDTSKGRFSAMVERQMSNLGGTTAAQSGSVEIIAMELGVVKSAVGNATTRNTAYAGQLETMLTEIETVTMEETAMQLLAIKTRLEASYSTTASVSQLSLVNYLR